MKLILLRLSGVQALVENAITAINTHTTQEVDRLMASLQEALDAHAGAVTTQLQQVRDAITAAQGSTGNEEALQASLDEALATIDAATARIEDLTTDLKSDDPQGPSEGGEPVEGGPSVNNDLPVPETQPTPPEGGEGEDPNAPRVNPL